MHGKQRNSRGLAKLALRIAVAASVSTLPSAWAQANLADRLTPAQLATYET